MGEFFGTLPTGETARLYTIRCGNLTAQVTDYGATLVRLFVPDKNGDVADVVLGYDDCTGYARGDAFFGATVGRNANRVRNATFVLNNRAVVLQANEKGNSLHSGPDCYNTRLWQVERYEDTCVTFRLDSPHGDQGFPGNAVIRVSYALKPPARLEIRYEAVSDRDTVFNLTNHSYFNLAGHQRPELAMGQILQLRAAYFTPSDAQGVPTGELRSVAGTPMDFRVPKIVGQDIDGDYESLRLQAGYDHSFQIDGNPCAVLCDPVSGREMEITTDCPGIHCYCGNFFRDEQGKDGVIYCRRGGIALETQYFPDAVHQPQWPQPIVKAGTPYRSQTKYIFK